MVDGKTMDVRVQQLNDWYRGSSYFGVINIESLRNEKIQDALYLGIKDGYIGAIIVDEIHKAKNGGSQQGKALRFLKAPVKIGLSGTPMNKAEDTMEMKKFYEGIYPNFDAGLFEKIREAFPSIDTKQTIRRLSKGMQKQVAFWLAISARPQILILDEPVDGLDPVMRRQIWSLILQDVTEHGTTVLVSSHNLRELEDVCDHVGIMNHGKIIIERSLSELQSSICKIQAAFQAEMPKLPKDLEVLHMSTTGRVHTMIVRGEPKQIKEQFTALNPMLMDVLPLSLEEIFIYELGGADYAVRDILF